MKLNIASCLIACALGTTLSGTAYAAEPTAPPSYPELFVDDVQHVLTAPSR